MRSKKARFSAVQQRAYLHARLDLVDDGIFLLPGRCIIRVRHFTYPYIKPSVHAALVMRYPDFFDLVGSHKEILRL